MCFCVIAFQECILDIKNEILRKDWAYNMFYESWESIFEFVHGVVLFLHVLSCVESYSNSVKNQYYEKVKYDLESGEHGY